MTTYQGTSGGYSGLLGALGQYAAGGGLGGAQASLDSQQAATNNAQNANARAGYGIQNQQVGNDLAHTMAGYGIDANNLQITGGTYNRQNQQLDASRANSETQAILQKQQQDLAAADARRAYAQQYSQNLGAATATGAVNAAGNRGDRASAAQELANKMTGFDQAKKGIDLDFQAYLQQYFGQKADLADSQAHLGNDVRALGNNQDAARTGAALDIRANNNQAAGVGLGQSSGGGAYSGGLGGGQGGTGIGGGNANGVAQLQSMITPHALTNVNNPNNPLGVGDQTWNMIRMLAVAQNGGVQNQQSLVNLQNLISFFGGIQAQTGGTAIAGTRRHPDQM